MKLIKMPALFEANSERRISR